MLSKNFERSLRFYEEKNQDGTSIWLPLVTVNLETANNKVFPLSLLFDTGASITALRANLYPLLGLQSWNEGQRIQTNTAGGQMDVYQYTAIIEIFEKRIKCPIILLDTLPEDSLYHGLLGRDIIFNEFGFGFWESTHELLITGNP